jgi:PAS domain S-box-containing protein
MNSGARADAILAAALASMTDSVYICDTAGRFVDCNDAFLALHRFPDKASCARSLAEYSELLESTLPDGRPIAADQRPAARALHGERASGLELRVRRLDTGEAWVGSYSFAPVRDPAGVIIGAVIVGRDVSREKHALDALRASEERLRFFIEHAPASLAMFDREMRYVAVSRRWLIDYGLGDANVVGRSHYEVFPEIGEGWKAVHQRGLRGEVVSANPDRFVRADGTVQWLRWEVHPWRDDGGDVGGIVIFTEDITAATHGAEALRDRERWFRFAQEAAKAGTWEWDLRSNANTWSDELWLLYGIPKGSREASYEAWREIIVPEDRSQAEEAVRDAASRGVELSSEFRVRHADGIHHLLSRGRPVLGDDGRPLKYLGIVIDITDRKQMEEALRNLNAELEDRVRRRTEQLEAANTELEAFSYSVSHDLRAPVRAVDGFAGLLERDYGNRLDAEGRRLLGVVRGESARMGALIDNLLMFSRVGRQPLNAQPVDLASLARDVFDSLGQERAGRFVELTVHALPPAYGDPDLLRQVVANLIGNAVKYTKPKPVASIVFGGRACDGECEYFVTDNGVGFDMKYVHKLFGVFQRLHAEDEFEGTGVGLALVQRIVQRHGGRIRADGVPDAGATFTFTLPGPSIRP